MSENLRDQINELIRDEIQDVINDYVDAQEETQKAGLGSVSYTHLTLPTIYSV